MTDQDASPPANIRPRRAARPSASNNPQTDTLDPSFPTPPPADPATAPPSADVEPPGQPRSTPDNRNHEKRLSGLPRAHKHRSSGGFLLTDSLLNRHGSTRLRDGQTPSRADQRSSIEQHTHHAAQHGQEGPPPRASSSSMHGASFGLGYGVRPSGHAEENPGSTMITKRDSLAGDTAVGSSPRTSIAQLDIDSAQIVNMALNLSESRRLASKRNMSQPTPPRLAPLPDGVSGGSLRYHLQQQRKISRTASPKPDRSPRVGSGRVFTPLQPAFEPGATYRYHFSQSTLARAQKAKEYLELMAQYRRVLELVPPLEPDRASRPWSATTPVTPNGSTPVSRVSTSEPEPKIGRPYNPLQYIRNRKVRARERKTIDGEAQGFNDVMKVSEWIDDVAKWVATGKSRLPGNSALPPFAGAEAAALQASPQAPNARTAAVTKPRRPRVDWTIDPADMLADIYWLELDDNKKLVEDRYWRRVFPQGLDIPGPLTRNDVPRLATPGSNKDSSDAHSPDNKATPEPPPARQEHERVLSTARDKAQQKLRALKGSHSRQTSLVTNRDLLRLHRGSLSESSDTDSDRRRRAKGAPEGTVRSVLEKQMEEVSAREQREAESHPLYDKETQRMKSIPMTPEREPRGSQAPSTRGRADSRAELSDTNVRSLGLNPSVARSPPQAGGRTSLEVPRARRFSVDNDSSQPNSPDLRPARDVGLVPTIGMDLSPMSSRPSSPHRNPLTRVKSIFRDRSKERIPETCTTGEDGVLSPQDGCVGSPDTPGTGVPSPQRRPSRSPARGRVPGHRSHKSLSSARLRGEDGGISFRSLLRGPRIDTVLRSSVSKVSDMIWRKDAVDDSSNTSSSDSEDESRGRLRRPRHGRGLSAQDANNLLEAPQLIPGFGKTGSPGQLQHPPTRPISRQSSRFELLKPPRIDVQNASPSVSPPPILVQPAIGSDTESQAGRDDVRAAAAGLDAALTLRNNSQSANRHWSIADRCNPPTRSSAAVSKREIARLRTLLLSSGIRAMEMSRRAQERKPLLPSTALTYSQPDSTKMTLKDLTPILPDPTPLTAAPLSQTDLYPLLAQSLSTSISAATSHFHSLPSAFTSQTAPLLLNRVESLRAKVAGELTSLTQSTIDEADEANHDLVVGQRLKVQRVVDSMEKMLRRRRRRFRWVRRAGWLVVEWVLVGCMWYVWFVVMIARVGLGVGKGVVRGVRWLLWL
ncbi:hypothetical protein VTI74DRAFT_4474 [Chaetomium olivicolor]